MLLRYTWYDNEHAVMFVSGVTEHMPVTVATSHISVELMMFSPGAMQMPQHHV